MLANDVWLRCRIALLAWGAALLGVGPAAGDVVLPTPGTAGWEHLRFPSVDRATEYRTLPDQGVVQAVSRCAASALVFPLDGVDLERTPLLRWRWRVLRLPGVEDERQRAGDDFAARVYVIFPFDPERSSALERLRRAVAQRVFGRSVPGSALNYVRTADEPAAARWDNPYASDSKMISLGQGPLPEWTAVEVDLRHDHRAAFGYDAPSPVAVAVMTDADDSCSEAEAWFADLRFGAPREPVP